MGKMVKDVSFIDLDVKGDIYVTGKVDGVDLSEHAADASIHHGHGNKNDLDKINQDLSTIGSPIFAGLTVDGNVTVSGKINEVDIEDHTANNSIHHTHENKSKLDSINQHLATVSSPTFAALTVNGDISVSGKVAGVDVAGHVANSAIHHTHTNKEDLDKINQNVATTATPTFSGLRVNGDIIVTGKVDGVEVSDHAANTMIHHEHGNKANLDSINQKLGTAESPTFAGLTLGGDLKVGGHVDGVKVSAHAGRHQSGGPDPLVGNLDANARLQIKANGIAVGTRRAVNFIAGENVLLIIEDNPDNEAVDITIKATGGGAAMPEMEKISGVAGEELDAFDFCYLKTDGRYYKANALDIATMPGLVLAGSALAAGESGDFIRRGRVINNDWNWQTTGGLIYASGRPGQLTQTLPSISGEQLQIVGVARSSNEIDFEPNLLLVEVA